MGGRITAATRKRTARAFFNEIFAFKTTTLKKIDAHGLLELVLIDVKLFRQSVDPRVLVLKPGHDDIRIFSFWIEN